MGSVIRARTQVRPSRPASRLQRNLAFLFILTLSFPVAYQGLTAYKIIGAGLAVVTLLAVFTRSRDEQLLDQNLAAYGLILVSAFFGSFSFGVVDTPAMLTLVQNVILYFVLLHTLRTRQDFYRVVLALALGGLLTVISGLQETQIGYSRVGGVFENANSYGQICGQTAICLVGLAYIWRRTWVRLVCFLLAAGCLLGLLYSASRGATIALCASIAALLVLRRVRRIVPTLVILGAMMLVVTGAPSLFVSRWETTLEPMRAGRMSALEFRLVLFERGIDVFLENPIMGVGAGNAIRAIGGQGFVPRVTHNVIVQALAETGVVGTLGFVFLLVSSMLSTLR